MAVLVRKYNSGKEKILTWQEDELFEVCVFNLGILCTHNLPTKNKNNCQLDNSRKINKANVDLVFHRNNLVLSPEDQQQDNITLVEAENQNISMTGASSNYEVIDSETDHDDVAIAKMTAYLNQQ